MANDSNHTSLTYHYADWGRIVEYLRGVDLDADDEMAPAFPSTLARIIEREADLWDDPTSPQTIVLQPHAHEQIQRVAESLGIEEVEPPPVQ